MSNTIAHRPHAHHHVSLTPILAVIVAIAIAAAVIYAINLPESTTTSIEYVSAPAPTIVVPQPDNPVFRHDLMRMGQTGQLRPYLTNLRHLVAGTTLDPVSTQPYSGTEASPNYERATHGR
jgi:hypothetical protein